MLIAQFAVIARDQLAVWQFARETARDVALSVDPIARTDQLRGTLPDDVSVVLVDTTVIVSVNRRATMSLAGFGLVTPAVSLRARVSMALEPTASP